ncbi:DUF917 domain-containing protein [Peribacillus loiseleuriae]|uniref:DUF917 domain-containing protein n=1 Tax=Peribacillus loiseleuriae TaxID=1679170 RepID=UPI003814815E
MSWQIKKQDIPFLAIGAKMIACGGGGNTKTIQSLLLSIMKDDDVITVKTMSDIDDEWIVGIGMMGSTILYDENIPSGEEGDQALKVYESIVQRRVDALISVEIGGINALAPLVTAVQNHLPVVDGDSMGRAFPELYMTTFYLNQIPLTPLVLQTHDVSEVIQGIHDIQIAAEKTKDFIATNGGYVHFVGFGAKARKMKTSMIPGSLKLIYRLGMAIKKDISIDQKMEEMLAVFGNSLYGKPHEIIRGEVTDVSKWFEQKSLIGKFTVEGNSSFLNKWVEIEFKNEFIAIKEKQYICTIPDLILVLDEESLAPYSVSEIQEGLSVIIFAVPAPSIIRTKDMLAIIGPHNFDLAVPSKLLQGDCHHEAWN